MAEVTDLHVLAKMSEGSPSEEDAFIIRKVSTGEEIYKIHNLKELIEILSHTTPEQIFPSLCRLDENEGLECDIALWIHYVLGDATLSAKIYNKVKEHIDDPEKMKIEIFNLCFNRYLNYQELNQSIDVPINDEKTPPPDL